MPRPIEGSRPPFLLLQYDWRDSILGDGGRGEDAEQRHSWLAIAAGARSLLARL